MCCSLKVSEGISIICAGDLPKTPRSSNSTPLLGWHGSPARQLPPAAVPQQPVVLMPCLCHQEKKPVKVAFCSGLKKKKVYRDRAHKQKAKRFNSSVLLFFFYFFFLNQHSCKPIIPAQPIPQHREKASPEFLPNPATGLTTSLFNVFGLQPPQATAFCNLSLFCPPPCII